MTGLRGDLSYGCGKDRAAPVLVLGLTVADTDPDTCTWKGINRDGGARGGRSRYDAASVASITEAYFRDGWQELTVWLGWDESGTEVARIGADPSTGERTWWAEAVPAEVHRV